MTEQKLTRRDFMGASLAVVAGATLGGCSGTDVGPSGALIPDPVTQRRPNILLVLVDEYRRSPNYPSDAGQVPALREILNFEPLSDNNPLVGLFPGLTRLRQNGVALKTHYVASAACVPSRATLLTGQYPQVHGVSQTTGFFKSGDDPGFVFLDPNGVPTVGDWFLAAGYETYYFGKWHVSETCDDLSPWGFPFARWDGPEPHGSDPANLGVCRDPEFANDTIAFLNSKAQSEDDTPWFAVSSYLAPHDISGWPLQWFLPGGVGVQNFPGNLVANPPEIPGQGVMSNTVATIFPNGTCPPPTAPPRDLNPGGYPQGTFRTPPTFGEDLSTKPDCQFDMAYKIGLCQRSILPGPLRPLAPNPFLLSPNPEEYTTAYGEWGCYLHHLFDFELNRVLQTLDATGLAENTIVIFTSDHGDYAGAHGGQIQKWHTAYEESVHVPMVVSSPLVNASGQFQEVTVPTSHIDLVPTLLSLAGFGPAQQQDLANRMTGQTPVPLRGSDLSPLLRNPSGGAAPERPGVLFSTIDEITQMTSVDPNNAGFPAYETFLGLVNDTRLLIPELTPGPVRQPNLVNALTDGEWKYCRYYDPNGVEADQFELYHLPTDGSEAVNLVDHRTGDIRPGVNNTGLSDAQLTARKNELARQLAQQEAALL